MKGGFFGNALCAAEDVNLEFIGPPQCSVCENDIVERWKNMGKLLTVSTRSAYNQFVNYKLKFV